ncbi:MAG: hypothetical protein KDJ68_13525 [Rhodobiaceae bacterium]|nr:hypothetical protein [Rhodobiaceae bacterium]
MPKEKRNHFVSRGLMRFWAQHDGKVIYWDKSSEGGLDWRNTKSVHKEDYLYARWQIDGRQDMEAENH